MAGPNLMLIALLVVLALTNWTELAQRVSDALSNWRRPGPPTHPLPGDDASILTRKRASRVNPF